MDENRNFGQGLFISCTSYQILHRFCVLTDPMHYIISAVCDDIYLIIIYPHLNIHMVFSKYKVFLFFCKVHSSLHLKSELC